MYLLNYESSLKTNKKDDHVIFYNKKIKVQNEYSIHIYEGKRGLHENVVKNGRIFFLTIHSSW